VCSIRAVKIRTIPSRIISEKAKFRVPIFLQNSSFCAHLKRYKTKPIMIQNEQKEKEKKRKKKFFLF
jgi:hypothetical protein